MSSQSVLHPDHNMPRSELAVVFARQLKRLEELGYTAKLSLAHHDALMGLEKKVLAINPLEVDEAMPFAIVIPESVIPLTAQLKLAGAYSFLPANEMHDRFDEPEIDQPYLIKDISAGKDTARSSSDNAVKKITSAGRLPLDIYETLAVILHYSVMNEDIRGLHAARTIHRRAGDEDTVIDLYRFADSLKVKRDTGDKNDPQWVTPSCKERVI
ncbi:MAG TPA: DUF5701 family protein [Candidatus Saccharimonadales bacterium]|nr:DUF5701 family protein [Candidatus Saccharimonadales bacterium]